MATIDGDRRRTRSEGLAWLLAGTAFFAYLTSTTGIVCSNDGSTYALIRAVGDEGRFDISTYTRYTGEVDYSVYDARRYTDRPPGTALVAVPFYVAGRFLDRTVRHSPEPHYGVLFARIVPALCCTLAGLIIYFLGLHMGVPGWAAVLVAVCFWFGSPAVVYGSVLFTHSAAALWCVASFAALATACRRPGSLCWLASGALIGLGPLFEYPNVVIGALMASGFLLTRRALGAKSVGLLCVGALLALPVLLVYNAVCFGSPLVVSYAYQGHFAWARGFSTTFAGRMADGFQGLLWRPRTGMLFSSPLLALGFIGMGIGLLRCRQWTLPMTLPAVGHIMLMSRHVSWYGGGTQDARYVFVILPLIFLGVFLWVQQIEHWPRVCQLAANWAMVLLAMISVLVSQAEWYGAWIHKYRMVVDLAPTATTKGVSFIPDFLQTRLPGLATFGGEALALTFLTVGGGWALCQVAAYSARGRHPGMSTQPGKARSR